MFFSVRDQSIPFSMRYWSQTDMKGNKNLIRKKRNFYNALLAGEINNYSRRSAFFLMFNPLFS